MSSENSKTLKFSTVTLTLLSLFFIATRITGFRILDESFELFCIHIPALASIVLYILIRYLQLKVEA
ncbi:MAG: hypothetical protein QXL27_06875 [Candidatus Bathyarchaeia archaeon]